LARTGWISLDGSWQFAEDPNGVGLAERWYDSGEPFAETITVPFPPESGSSGIARDVSDIIWYRLSSELARPAEGIRRLIHFEAIDYRSSIWVNGAHLADHEGGQTRVSVDATNMWSDADNSIVVRAVDERRDIEQPRGKQDWNDEPHVIWYRRTSGIWRSVWIEDVPATRIESLVWSTGSTFGLVDLEARFAGPIDEGHQISVTLSHKGRVLARSQHSLLSSRLRIQLSLEDSVSEPEPEQLWWSPENPQLIEAELTVTNPNGRSDEVQSYFGFRSVGADDRSFLLNNRPYFLRLALEQGYWPHTHLAAPSEDDLRREVELIKELGFNGVRIHQKVADSRFLYWCDRLGLVVWADAAASYRFSPLSLSRTTREWLEIVERDRNHPSIVAWVAFNESWGVPEISTDRRQRAAVLALYNLLVAVDGSRIVIANDGWEFVGGDIAAVHDYSHDPAVFERRYSQLDRVRDTIATGRTGGRKVSLVSADSRAHVPVVLSEFGGINLADAAETWKGYGQVANAADLVAELARLFEWIGEDSGLAGFCYTQLTDTVQERNGLLTEAREFKADPTLISAIVRGDVVGRLASEEASG